MKVKKIIVSTTEHDIDITGATLFTIEEAKKLPEKSRKYNKWWWLKSPCGFDSYHSSCVYTDGFISDFGEYVNYNCVACRPVLTISNLESAGLKIGDTFEFGGQKFEIISDDKAFCLGDIGTCVFRKDNEAPDANVYEKPDIKKYIDDWFKNSKQENVK